MSSAAETGSEPDRARETIARLDAMSTRHRVAYQGRAVCWRRFGDGPPLLLIHGGHGNWQHWIRNIAPLSNRHTVWVPDLPGFGDSDDLAADAHAPDRLQRLVDAVIGSLDTLVGRHARIDLAGFSFGGLVAAQLAAQRGHVRRLALLGSTGHGGPRRQSVELVDWRLPDRTAMLAALRHNLRAFMLHNEASMDALALAVHEAGCVQTRFRSKPLSRAALLQSVLKDLPQPTLFIWGEHDATAIPEQLAPQLAQGGGTREWCLVPGAGHWVQFERHREIDQLLLRWFGDEDEDSGN